MNIDSKTLETIIAGVARATGVSSHDIHLIFGWYDGAVGWSCVIPRGRVRPAFEGVQRDPHDAAQEAVNEWRRWKNPEIADRESKARLLKEIGLSDDQVTKLLK